VPHIVRPGETLASGDYRRFAGGKGANQSVALARAGAEVLHVGMVGLESVWLRERLADEGVNVDHVRVADGPGGHAIIQVDSGGQNSIVLFGGANLQIGDEHLAAALATVNPGDILLVQNETNCTGRAIAAAHETGLRVCFNPAPMADNVLGFPLDRVDLFVLNDHEAEALSGHVDPERALCALAERYPNAAVCLTLGARGARYRDSQVDVHCPAETVEAVDTTAAGDTFIGFLLADLARGISAPDALATACAAAALSVTRAGAMDSIPLRADLDA
jgi:ribokinase